MAEKKKSGSEKAKENLLKKPGTLPGVKSNKGGIHFQGGLFTPLKKSSWVRAFWKNKTASKTLILLVNLTCTHFIHLSISVNKMCIRNHCPRRIFC